MAKKICRTCLKYTVLSFKTHDTLNNPGEPGQLKISDVLRYLVPELYLGVTTNPEICFECRGAIRSAYKFRKQCLSTENLIGSYLKNARCTARSVDLYEVLEFLENTPAAKPANANISDQNQSAPETYAQKIISDWEDEASEESNVEVLSHSENKTTKETVAENISANAVETLTGNKEQISESGEKSQNKNIRVRTNLFRIDNVFTLFDDEFKDNSKINEKVQKQNSEGVSKEKLFSQEDSHTQTLKKLLEQPKILTPLDNLSNQPISSRKMLADLLKSSDKEQNKKLNSNTVDDCLLNIKEEPLDVDINKDLENSSATANDEDTLTAPESVAYDDIQGLINNIPNAYNNQYVDVPDFVQINNFSMTDFEELRKLQEPQTIANQLIPLQPGTFSVAGSTLVQPTQNKIFHTIVNSKPLLSPGNNITFTNLDMVGKYARRTTRQSWSEADMTEAIRAVQNGEMGWLAASKRYNVPQATLRRRAQGRNKKITGSDKGLGRYGPTFSVDLERLMIDYIKTLEISLFELTTVEVRRLAFEFAVRNNITHRFNVKKKIAGWDWFVGFRSRNPDISLKIPEATSAARAQGFNKPQVQKFFEILEKTMAEHKISFERIYNVDEYGLSTVQHPQERKQVDAVTSVKRGVHTTAVCCMNPKGIYIPPALIFARKNWKSELINDGPTGTLGLCHEYGWITGELFYKWLEHFIKYSHSSQDNKTLLLLDGHTSHKNLNALLLAKENGVILLCIPPHCTDKLQPLELSFFGPLSTFYNQAVTTWLKNNPDQTVGEWQVGKLFAKAYECSATMENSVSGFKNTGIYPFNANIFPDWMFASNITDHPHQKDDANLSLTHELAQTSPAKVSLAVPNEEINNLIIRQMSKDLNTNHTLAGSISPIPKASTSNRKRQGTVALASTPDLDELEVKDEEKRAKCRKATKNLRETETDDQDVESEDPFSKAEKVNDAPCIYCNGLYSETKPGDVWLRCQKCKKCTHAQCADVSPKVKNFICEICC